MVTLELRKTEGDTGGKYISQVALCISSLRAHSPSLGNSPSIETIPTGLSVASWHVAWAQKAYPHSLNMVSGVWGVVTAGDAARTDEGRMMPDGDGGRVSRDSDIVYVYVGTHTHYSSFHMTQCVMCPT